MSKLEPNSSINPSLMLGYLSHKTLATMQCVTCPPAIHWLYSHYTGIAICMKLQITICPVCLCGIYYHLATNDPISFTASSTGELAAAHH